MKEKLINYIKENTEPYQGIHDDFEMLESLSIDELKKIADNIKK